MYTVANGLLEIQKNDVYHQRRSVRAFKLGDPESLSLKYLFVRIQNQGRITMKLRVNYCITDQDKYLLVLKEWISLSPENRANDAGDGVKMIGRWHDMAGRTGVAIVESNDLAAVQRWIGKWNPYMNMELTPVLDDEESAAVGRHIVADNNA
jgi:hypothetical protein